MEYAFIAIGAVCAISLVIWSITDLLKEIRAWMDHWQFHLWLTLHDDVTNLKAELRAMRQQRGIRQ
jgi:hypothetical protein